MFHFNIFIERYHKIIPKLKHLIVNRNTLSLRSDPNFVGCHIYISQENGSEIIRLKNDMHFNKCAVLY